jgi:hypothetical protein
MSRQWLEGLDYGKHEEERIEINIVYGVPHFGGLVRLLPWPKRVQIVLRRQRCQSFRNLGAA